MTGKYPPTPVDLQFVMMLNYYVCLQEIEEEEIKCNNEVAGPYIEFSNVGTRLGEGFEDTNELKPMKSNEVINGPDGEVWKREIKNEHNCMVNSHVFEEVDKSDLPEVTKFIDITWTCKKKCTGTLHG